MAADNWTIYDSFLEYVADGTIDIDDDSFTMALVSSTYTPDTANHTTWSDASGAEVSGGGYSAYSLTQTWVESGGTATFDTDDATFTASSTGTITARYAIIYDDTPAAPADPLVAYSLLDNSPADVSVSNSNTLTVGTTASIFTMGTT